jgi:hypothetical protein
VLIFNINIIEVQFSLFKQMKTTPLREDFQVLNFFKSIQKRFEREPTRGAL